MSSGRHRAKRHPASVVRQRLGAAFAAVVHVLCRGDLRRAELAYAWSGAGEWACAVGLGVVAFRDGGPTTVGLVAVARMVPAALASPFVATIADLELDREVFLDAVGASPASGDAARAVVARRLATFAPAGLTL